MGKEITTVWVFDEEALELALRSYREEAMVAYPQQIERTDLAVKAIRDFLHSSHARALTMGSK